MDRFNTANMKVSVFATKAGVNPRRLPAEEIDVQVSLGVASSNTAS